MEFCDSYNVAELKVQPIINSLSENDKKYATYMSLAAWAPFPILLDSVSAESPAIHRFFQKLFAAIPHDKQEASLKPDAPVSLLPLKRIIEYAAHFYANAGNYRGFGDSKFIPHCTKDEFRAVVSELGNQELTQLLEACIDSMYSMDPDYVKQIGFYPTGCTHYFYPGHFSKSEADQINAVIKASGLRFENTTINRTESRYEVSIACIDQDEDKTNSTKIGEVNGKPVVITKGRGAEYLAKSVFYLKEAQKYANPTQKKMIDYLILSYQHGKVEDHIEYSRAWVEDVDPVVETHHGFIETYRDPSGLRAEYEGFVSCVDPEESKALHKYVDSSSIVLPLMPYPKEYERNSFKPPSYNALNVLTYCSTCIPLGIDIPNYDEIRLKFGFKNVTLQNVSAAMTGNSTSPFIDQQAKQALEKFGDIVDTMATASHELYGHGSGKLLEKSDIEKGVPDIFNPSEKVTTYYPEGTTYDVAFGAISSSYEECRAETTSLYLCLFDQILDIFGIKPEDRLECKLAHCYDMFLSLMRGFFAYNPEAKEWKQAHVRARYVLLKAAILWSNGAVKVEKIEGQEITDENNKKDANYRLFVDINKIENIKEAMGILLKHLNYYKSTNQPEKGNKFYDEMSQVDDFWLGVQKDAIRLRPNRTIIIGAVVRKEGNEYNLTQFKEGAPTILDLMDSILENICISTA